MDNTLTDEELREILVRRDPDEMRYSLKLLKIERDGLKAEIATSYARGWRDCRTKAVEIIEDGANLNETHAAIRALEPPAEHTLTTDHIPDFGRMVGDAILSAKPGDGWIPVAERLPETGYPVLAGGIDHSRAREARHTICGWTMPNDEKLPGVTHWRPLPEPPR